MEKLREKMKMDLKLKGYSPKTQTAYLGYMKNFARYFGRSPAKMGKAEIRRKKGTVLFFQSYIVF